MHKSKNIVHINTKAKRSQTSCLQEVWPFYSLTSVKDGSITSPAIPCNYNAILQYLPAKNLSEIIPEKTVPTIPHTELIDIIKLASKVE